MSEKIALGLGDNTDYEIVWNSTVFENLIRRHGICAAELAIDKPITSERDLAISILGFLQAGTGGERHVAASAIVEEFAQNFAMKITLGGTSVRAAIAMHRLGYTSALHLVTINEHVRRLIPQDSPYVCSNTVDSSFPHLIVQFDKGTRVCAGDIDVCSSRANRIIYHDDTDNVTMRLNEGFGDLIKGARVFLVSGFNAMRDEELLVDRLASLQRIMDRLPRDARVFFEDAGYYNPSFHKLIVATLAQRISIFSLNEDELQGHLGRRLNLLDIFDVAAALLDLRRLFAVPVTVVHSMYWALAYGDDAQSMASALKGGVTMATTRFHYGDDFIVENYREIENLPPNPEGAQFAAAIGDLLGSQVCVVPVAQVDQSNGTTIGLGDAFVGGFLPALV
jgi:ADP-dependent phosphofructokinase/glucokinase